MAGREGLVSGLIIRFPGTGNLLQIPVKRIMNVSMSLQKHPTVYIKVHMNIKFHEIQCIHFALEN